MPQLTNARDWETIESFATGRKVTKNLPTVFERHVSQMVSLTRRHLLHVATAIAGGLAGCSQFTGGESSSTRSVSSGGSAGPDADALTDPPMVRRRAAEQPIRLGDRERTDSPGRDRLSSRDEYEVIDAQSTADRLAVADGLDAEEVSSFVAATDFDSETLYLETRSVEECFRLRLCHISWQSDKVHTDYVRPLRPYDERCRADEHVFESRLIRLPVALDAESVRSYGSSVSGSSRCRGGSRRAEMASGSDDETTTTGSGDETTAESDDETTVTGTTTSETTTPRTTAERTTGTTTAERRTGETTEEGDR